MISYLICYMYTYIYIIVHIITFGLSSTNVDDTYRTIYSTAWTAVAETLRRFKAMGSLRRFGGLRCDGRTLARLGEPLYVGEKIRVSTVDSWDF